MADIQWSHLVPGKNLALHPRFPLKITSAASKSSLMWSRIKNSVSKVAAKSPAPRAAVGWASKTPSITSKPSAPPIGKAAAGAAGEMLFSAGGRIRSEDCMCGVPQRVRQQKKCAVQSVYQSGLGVAA